MNTSKAIANATAAGSFTVDIDLDDSYDLLTGVAVTDDAAGLGSKYTVGLQNSAGSILDPLPIDVLGVAKEDGSTPNQRFLDLMTPIKGAKRITVTITTTASATADTTVYISFRIVRTGKPVSV